MLYLPTTLHALPPHLPPRRWSSISLSHAHCPHTPPHSSNLDTLSGCKAWAYPFPQEGSEDFHGPTLNFCSVYWTNPLFVNIKAWCYRVTFHNPPLPSPSKDHDASPLLPSSWSCSGVRQLSVLAALLVVNPDSNTTRVVGSGKRKAGQGRSGKPVSLSRRDGIFYLLSVLRQLSVLATLLVVNPDPNTTGVVGVGKRKVGQGRSGKPVSLSRCGGIFYSLLVLRVAVGQIAWVSGYRIAR
ncbi:hypothetical protein EDB87DRAFT_1574669 [Lactarius vividus]|nr:hypothetical protein EDB87DRAFT_1574669 [Lactarius vividus]